MGGLDPTTLLLGIKAYAKEHFQIINFATLVGLAFLPNWGVQIYCQVALDNGFFGRVLCHSLDGPLRYRNLHRVTTHD